MEYPQHIGSPSVSSPEHYIAIAAAFMSPQSCGSITLGSKNPSDPPLIDPNFLHEDFDKRVVIEAVREAMAFLNSPALMKDHVKFAASPEGTSDEEIMVRYHYSDSQMNCWRNGRELLIVFYL